MVGSIVQSGRDSVSRKWTAQGSRKEAGGRPWHRMLSNGRAREGLHAPTGRIATAAVVPVFHVVESCNMPKEHFSAEMLAALKPRQLLTKRSPRSVLVASKKAYELGHPPLIRRCLIRRHQTLSIAPARLGSAIICNSTSSAIRDAITRLRGRCSILGHMIVALAVVRGVARSTPTAPSRDSLPLPLAHYSSSRLPITL